MLKSESLVVQANQLIENKPLMNIDETRLFLSIVALVDIDKDEFQTLYKIPIHEISSVWGMSQDSAYEKIKIAVRGLVKKEFFVNSSQSYLSTTFLASGEYKQKEAIIELEISTKFKPYLLALSRTFTRYILENIVHLSYSSSIRLYELMKQYQVIGQRTFEIEDFKSLMGITGKYSGNNSNLEKRVVIPAIKDINENTDIFLTYRLIGRGKKAKLNISVIDKNSFEAAAMIKKRYENGSVESEAEKVLKKYNIDSTPENFMKFILDDAIAEVKKPTAYLRSCLKGQENAIRYKKYLDDKKEKGNKRLEIEELAGQMNMLENEEKEKQREEFFSDIPKELRELPDGLEKIKRITAYKSSKVFKEVE